MTYPTYPCISDFQIHVVNKNTEKSFFPYQVLHQNVSGAACLIGSILIKHSQIRCKLLLKHKLPDELLLLRKVHNYTDCIFVYLVIKFPETCRK